MSHKVILHLSDTHFFGWAMRPGLAERIVEEAHALAPDLVIVSGDLTQRAFHRQFLAARQWLDALPRPLLVVPGNHDIPLLNLWERLRRPLDRYRRYISEETDPVYEDEGLLVVGLCSARGTTTENGWLDPAQLARAARLVQGRRPGQATAIVVHHHFLPVPGSLQRPIRGAADLLRTFDRWGVDLVLTGHSHRAYVHRTEGGLLLLQAGTATSTRGKGNDRGRNNYFVIHVDEGHLEVTRWQYDAEARAFAPVLTEAFPRRVFQEVEVAVG
jgi:3',5'-cyclic AMP phosphodiesterase CpdA